MDDHYTDPSDGSTTTIRKYQFTTLCFFTYNKFKGDRSIDRKCSTTGFKIRRGGLTVVQSLQTPPKPQEPSSGEQQGGYKEMSASVIV